jgi:HSP20 family molecular chaperone IbpA
VARFFPIDLRDFDRAFDELFDEMLIARWRIEPQSQLSKALVLDFGDRYEIRISTGPVRPEGLEIEASERHLTVRMPTPDGSAEQSYTFSDAVDADKATSRWEAGTLTAILPKKSRGGGSRRVHIETTD